MALLTNPRTAAVAVAAAALSWIIPTAYAADKSAADYFVHSLPGAPATPYIKMHAGYVFRPNEQRSYPVCPIPMMTTPR